MKKLKIFLLLILSFMFYGFCEDINSQIISEAPNEIIQESIPVRKTINYDFIYQLITNGVTIIVAFIAGYLPSYLNKKNDSKKKKSEKIESLYVDVSEWFNSSFLGLTAFNMVLRGEMTSNQYDEWFTKNCAKGNYLRSEISLYLYFPDIEKEYKDMIKAVQNAFSYTWTLKAKTHFTETDLKKYREYVALSNNNFEKFKNKLIEETRHCK